MGRNEIRIRRQMMSSGRIAQHRNYGELMARHERDVRLKRIVRIFIYFLLIAFLIVLFFMFQRWSKKTEIKHAPNTQTAHMVPFDSHSAVK